MPRAKSSSPQSKPYKKPQPKQGAASTSSKSWTNTEYAELFEHVLCNGRSKWEGAVPGRTSNQSYQVWRNTLEPFLKSAIAAKPGGRGKGKNNDQEVKMEKE